MNCIKCKINEATHDAPGKWCDKCWDDWWFKDTPDVRDEDQPFIYVLRAYGDLGKVSESKIIRYAKKIAYTKVTDIQLKQAIKHYKELNV